MNELPDTSRKFAEPTPWWIAPSRSRLGRTITLRSALLIALVVGVIAGTFGAASSGSLFGRSVN